MRHVSLLLTLLLFAAVSGASAQQPPEVVTAKPPAKGDGVVVRGCLSGNLLYADETRRNHDSGWLVSTVTFRLTGPRDVLRSLRSEHEGEMMDVSGVLKSDLPDDRSVPRGKQIGKTRIFVGIGQSPRGNSPGDDLPYMPVVEVKSFEPAGGRCSPR